MKLRQIAETDVEVLGELEYSNMNEILGSVLDLSRIKTEIINYLSNAWKVLDETGSIAGFYYWEKDEDASVLVSIQVKPEQRGKGYGTLMLEHWESESAKMGFDKLGLAVHTNNPAYEWYRRHGFRYFDEDGPNCHMLIKLLKR